MNNGLLARLQHLHQVINIGPSIEIIADIEVLKVLVAIQLLVIRVGDVLELRLIRGGQDGIAIPAEIRAGHRHDMGAVAGEEVREVNAKLAVGVGGHVVELVNRDQTVVEGGDAEFLHRETKRRMRANQRPVGAGEKRADGIHLAAIRARRVAQVPPRCHRPIRPEAVLRERLIVETGADRALRHHHDGLLQPLVVQFIERNEHQCAAFAGGRGGFDEQILLTPALKSLLLHRPHTQRIGPRSGAGGGIANGDGRYRSEGGAHAVDAGHVGSFGLARGCLRPMAARRGAMVRGRSRAPWSTASMIRVSPIRS